MLLKDFASAYEVIYRRTRSETNYRLCWVFNINHLEITKGPIYIAVVVNIIKQFSGIGTSLKR
jgi:hypothetical protein